MPIVAILIVAVLVGAIIAGETAIAKRTGGSFTGSADLERWRQHAGR